MGVEYSRGMMTLALTELLGPPVVDSAGRTCGHVREVALTPQEDRVLVSVLIVKTRAGDRLLPSAIGVAINGKVRHRRHLRNGKRSNGSEGLFLLERDLLDQQVIDVHGRKVVRVNDVDLIRIPAGTGRYSRSGRSM